MIFTHTMRRVRPSSLLAMTNKIVNRRNFHGHKQGTVLIVGSDAVRLPDGRYRVNIYTKEKPEGWSPLYIGFGSRKGAVSFKIYEDTPFPTTFSRNVSAERKQNEAH